MARVDELTPEEAIDQMSEEAVICRDLSHSWKHWYANRITGGFERGLRCATCGTARKETLNSRGQRVGSVRYEYPEHYRVKGAGYMNKDFRAAVRLTSLLRLIKDT
jgi:hypothetical protein